MYRPKMKQSLEFSYLSKEIFGSRKKYIFFFVLISILLFIYASTNGLILGSKFKKESAVEIKSNNAQISQKTYDISKENEEKKEPENSENKQILPPAPLEKASSRISSLPEHASDQGKESSQEGLERARGEIEKAKEELLNNTSTLNDIEEKLPVTVPSL